jgi:hypothetical protein
MQTRLTLQPSQRGAKKLLAKYGDRLICVRYRYDAQHKRRLKTVELIVEEYPWSPETKQQNDERKVHLRVAASEVEARRQVKGAGGVWNPQLGVWEISYARVVALKMENRITPRQKSI